MQLAVKGTGEFYEWGFPSDLNLPGRLQLYPTSVTLSEEHEL
jgi:hypothetical protein